MCFEGRNIRPKTGIVLVLIGFQGYIISFLRMNLVVLGDVDMRNQAGVSKHQVDREYCKQVLV